MSQEYRQLTPNDLLQLKSLLRVFGEAFQDVPTYHGAVPDDTYLQHWLSKPDVIALVALQRNEVVGGLVAYELQKFEQNRKEIYIYDLAVDEKFRRQGIATGLIKQLQTIAKDRGAYVVYVQADKGDESAIKLYESLGTKEEVFHFDIPV